VHIWSTNEYVVSMDRINRILPFILHQIAFDRFAFLNNTTKSVRIEQAPKTLLRVLWLHVKVVETKGQVLHTARLCLNQRKRGLFAMRKINLIVPSLCTYTVNTCESNVKHS